MESPRTRKMDHYGNPKNKKNDHNYDDWTTAFAIWGS